MGRLLGGLRCPIHMKVKVISESKGLTLTLDFFVYPESLLLSLPS